MVLSKFYVEKSHRGKGLAHAMMDALLAAVRGAGLRRVELNTFRGNADTIAVYERLGFHKLRE